MKTPPLFLAHKKHYLFYGLFISVLAHAAIFSTVDHWWPDSPAKAIPVSLSLQTLVVSANTDADSPIVSKPVVPKKTESPKSVATKKVNTDTKLKVPKPLLAKKAVHPQKPAARKKPLQETKAPRAIEPPVTALAKKSINKMTPPNIAKNTEKPPVQLTKAETPTANSGYLAPQPISQMNKPPKYPEKAERQGLEGHLLISAVIGLEVEISNISIKKSSGHRLFDRAAVKAIAKWKFRAASRHGIKEVASIELPIRFQLN